MVVLPYLKKVYLNLLTKSIEFGVKENAGNSGHSAFHIIPIIARPLEL